MVANTHKRFRNKKKMAVGMVPALLFFLSACAGPTHHACQTNWPTPHAVNPTLPAPANPNSDRGVYLKISKRASLNIDVECIIDYVQGNLPMTPDAASVNTSSPWIVWDWHF